MLSYQEAISEIIQAVPIAKTIRKNLLESLGYTLAEDIFSNRDYPPFNRAAMDGFAIRSSSFHPNKRFKIIGNIQAGESFNKLISSNETVKIMTGSALPKESVDCIIPVEKAQENIDDVEFLTNTISKGQNIAIQGEDLKKGEIAIEKGSYINQSTILTLSSLGITSPKVYRTPKVSIITTGNEVVSLNQEPKDNEIYNCNLYTLLAGLSKYCCEIIKTCHIKDEPSLIEEALLQSISNSDLVLITGGVSMGDSDFVPRVLEKIRTDRFFHKSNIQPGKPVWFGHKEKCHIFALPGNPLSVQITFKIFVEPFILSMQNRSMKALRFPLLHTIKKKHHKRLFFPAILKNYDKVTYIERKKINGSGDIRASLCTDGIGVFIENKTEILKGDFVDFYPWYTL